MSLIRACTIKFPKKEGTVFQNVPFLVAVDISNFSSCSTLQQLNSFKCFSKHGTHYMTLCFLFKERSCQKHIETKQRQKYQHWLRPSRIINTIHKVLTCTSLLSLSSHSSCSLSVSLRPSLSSTPPLSVLCHIVPLCHVFMSLHLF